LLASSCDWVVVRDATADSAVASTEGPRRPATLAPARVPVWRRNAERSRPQRSGPAALRGGSHFRQIILIFRWRQCQFGDRRPARGRVHADPDRVWCIVKRYVARVVPLTAFQTTIFVSSPDPWLAIRRCARHPPTSTRPSLPCT
jgi:hypothetical protein